MVLEKTPWAGKTNQNKTNQKTQKTNVYSIGSRWNILQMAVQLIWSVVQFNSEVSVDLLIWMNYI